jgi:5-methylcytosine-specific restriction endonuclease McrA
MGLIERIVKKDEKGKIKGWYIKINYLYKKDTVNDLLESKDTPQSLYTEFEMMKKDNLIDKLYCKNSKCVYCGDELIRLKDLYVMFDTAKDVYKYIKDNNIKYATIDHRIPLSKNGTNDLNNMVISCQICNSKKGVQLTENELVDLPTSGNQTTNALSYSNISALSNNNINALDKQNTLSKQVDYIYYKYPSKCSISGRSTHKSYKDKDKIGKLIKKVGFSELLDLQKKYIYVSKKQNTWIKNYSTFLNNLPDYTYFSDPIAQEKKAKEIQEALSEKN